MFRRLPHTLPPDPSFPADLGKLGFFINDDDQIRQIKNPSQKFQYKMNHNERVNEVYKHANNLAVRKIIQDRLHVLGLETVRLPLGARETDKHVPILVSKDIHTKDRVIVFLGERQMEPGVLSWRVIGETGIRHGSLVDFVDAVLNGPTPTSQHSPPGIIVANPCQLLWFRGGSRAVSHNEWMDLPRPTAVSEAMRQDKVKNYIEHNRDYREHVHYIFDHVLPELVSKDAKIDLIGVEYAASAGLEYLAEHWNEWSGRITGICLANAQYKMEDLVQDGAPPEFVSFISKRCRAYSVSPSPLEAPIAGRERFGCNCYASGEHDYHENAVVKGWRSMLDWFNILNANPAHEEVEFTYVEDGDEEQAKMVWSAQEVEEALAKQAEGNSQNPEPEAEQVKEQRDKEAGEMIQVKKQRQQFESEAIRVIQVKKAPASFPPLPNLKVALALSRSIAGSSQSAEITSPTSSNSSIPQLSHNSTTPSLLLKMVKFRGIEISVISQVDICRLPEYLYPPAARLFNNSLLPPNPPQYPIASCSIPIYPGSQIWLEYTIEGPHPPGAAYFFKLLLNGNEVTAWDCTSKHGFHGKMMYTLVNEGQDAVTGKAAIRRQVLKFGDELPHYEQDPAVFPDDYIQINVHRIEHRQRIRDLEEGVGSVNIENLRPDGIRLSNGGLLDSIPRPRRYKYQLLDPKDAPYAAFRFFCRPAEDLDDCGVVPLQPYLSSSICGSSESSSNTEQSPTQYVGAVINTNPGASLSSPNSHELLAPSPSPRAAEVRSQSPIKLSLVSEMVAMSDSDDSLSVKTKDSIEELASNVSRSPRSPKNKSPRGMMLDTNELPPSPTKSPLTRKGLRRKLTLNIDGADFDLEKKRRPLSPFTTGGLLRKTSLPQTAPASVTEFGPSVEDEVRARLEEGKGEHGNVNKSKCWSTSSERGGKSLMGFLGRRMASGKAL